MPRTRVLYIAGPMTGIPEFNYPAFKQAQKELEAVGYIIESPVWSGDEHKQTKLPYEYFLKRGFGQVLNSDGIALLPDALRSKGATREVMLGRWISIQAMPVERWIELAATHTIIQEEL